MDRKAAIDRILMLQQALAPQTPESGPRKGVWMRLKVPMQCVVVYGIIGRRLSRSLAELVQAVHERRRPYLGTELANALEAVSRKVMGYKRVLILLGLMAALPGMVSVSLLWQQNQALAQAKEARFADLRNQKRVELLTTLYQTVDKSEAGSLTTPVFSAANRRDAVFALIDWDSRQLEQLEQDDPLQLNRMVDLSVAPLNDIDFAAIPGEPAPLFHNVSFVNSNFDNASFENCRLERVWFSHAQLYHTRFRNARLEDVDFGESRIVGADFTGAEFIRCSFEGALFDPSTRWPEGFDAIAHGAQRLEP